MNYYKLNIGNCSPETGTVYPQVQKMNSGYNYNEPNSVYALARYYKSFPEFSPNLDSFVLHRSAKPSDFLSNSIISSVGFLMSGKAKMIFECCKLTDHKFYQASVICKNNLINYFWLHYICNVREFVIYEESEFNVCMNFTTILGSIKILSEENLILKEQTLKINNPGHTISILAKKIILNSSFNKNIDLFKVGKFDIDLYISERLMNLINSNNLTGVEITPATNIVVL